MSDKEAVIETNLVNLDGLLLTDIEEFDDSALAHALRRVLADADGPEDPIAGFQSFI